MGTREVPKGRWLKGLEPLSSSPRPAWSPTLQNMGEKRRKKGERRRERRGKRSGEEREERKGGEWREGEGRTGKGWGEERRWWEDRKEVKREEGKGRDG